MHWFLGAQVWCRLPKEKGLWCCFAVAQGHHNGFEEICSRTCSMVSSMPPCHHQGRRAVYDNRQAATRERGAETLLVTCSATGIRARSGGILGFRRIVMIPTFRANQRPATSVFAHTESMGSGHMTRWLCVLAIFFASRPPLPCAGFVLRLAGCFRKCSMTAAMGSPQVCISGVDQISNWRCRLCRPAPMETCHVKLGFILCPNLLRSAVCTVSVFSLKGYMCHMYLFLNPLSMLGCQQRLILIAMWRSVTYGRPSEMCFSTRVSSSL